MKILNAYIYPTLEEFGQRADNLRRECNPAVITRAELFDDLKQTTIPETSIQDILTNRFGDLIIGRDSIEPNEFVWRSHNGSLYNVTDMATPHLLFALRMIFNHTVAPAFRVLRPGEAMRRYPEVPFWNEDYKQRACLALAAELEQRNDLDESFATQFADIKANTRVILALGL